jgi:hypothetical protein
VEVVSSLKLSRISILLRMVPLVAVAEGGMATGRRVVVAAECCLIPTAAMVEANRLAEKKE